MVEQWNALFNAQFEQLQTIFAATTLALAALLFSLLLIHLLTSRRVKRLRREHEIGNDMVLAVLAEMRQNLTTTVEGVGQLRGAVGELPTRADQDARDQSANDQAGLEQIRDDWNAIRDELERRAADADLPWQTRAKYGRIDRRNYYRLIEKMVEDSNLPHDARDFRAAADLWNQHKNGRRAPDKQALILMADLRKRVIGGQS